MKSTVRFAPIALVALLGLGLAGCGKQEQQAAPAATEQVALSVPADPNDERAWKLYLTNVVKQNLPEKLRTSPFMYYLPAATREDFQGEYERQLDNVYGTVERGVLPGNMLAFGSPESAKMADLIVASFKGVPADTMKGVRVLFIGDAADNPRVQAAVAPAGVDYVFVEAK